MFSYTTLQLENQLALETWLLLEHLWYTVFRQIWYQLQHNHTYIIIHNLRAHTKTHYQIRKKKQINKSQCWPIITASYIYKMKLFRPITKDEKCGSEEWGSMSGWERGTRHQSRQWVSGSWTWLTKVMGHGPHGSNWSINVNGSRGSWVSAVKHLTHD